MKTKTYATIDLVSLLMLVFGLGGLVIICAIYFMGTDPGAIIGTVPAVTAFIGLAILDHRFFNDTCTLFDDQV